MDCKCHNIELRYILDSRRRKMFCFQCPECGKKSGQWQPTPTHGDYLPVDADLGRRFFEKRQNEYQMQRAMERRKKHHNYEVYINQDIKWKEIRSKVMARCDRVCECCLTQAATQVHHVNYDSLFDEIAWDLRGVCRECHQKIHGRVF